MTEKHNRDNPEINEILLSACHCYMLTSGYSPSQFVSYLHSDSSAMSKLIATKLKKDLKKLENGDKSFWQRLGLLD